MKIKRKFKREIKKEKSNFLIINLISLQITKIDFKKNNIYLDFEFDSPVGINLSNIVLKLSNEEEMFYELWETIIPRAQALVEQKFKDAYWGKQISTNKEEIKIKCLEFFKYFIDYKNKWINKEIDDNNLGLLLIEDINFEKPEKSIFGKSDNEKIEIFIEKIQELINKSSYEKAIYETNKILNIYPNNLRILKLKAKLENYINNYNDSIEIYKKIIELEPENKDNYYEIIKILFKIGKSKQALKYVDIILKYNNNDLPAILIKSQLLYNLGKKNWENLLDKAYEIDKVLTTLFVHKEWNFKKKHGIFQKTMDIDELSRYYSKEKQEILELLSKKEIPGEYDEKKKKWICYKDEIEAKIQLLKKYPLNKQDKKPTFFK